MSDPAPPPPTFDSYKPAQIAALMEDVGVAKSRLPAPQMFVLAVLAGAFIGFGAAGYTMVMTGTDPGFGPSRFLGGLVFSLGLILVIVGGAELFTGNALMIMAAVDRRITVAALMRNWGIVYLGNTAGAVALAAGFGLSGLLDGPMGETAARIGASKANLPPLDVFVRGILCNALVCLAVWLTFSARTTEGKILAIVWPISTFVLLGLEHSIANLFFFPLALAAGADIPAAGIVSNLVWATLGNVVGGGAGVALAYRFAYLGPATRG